MPQLNGDQVPKYRLQRSRGLAVVRLNGVDHYLGPWKSKASYVEYDRLVSEWLANGRVVPTQTDDHQFSIVELVAKYLDHAKEYYRKVGKSTREYGCIMAAVRPLRKLYGRQAANQFGPLKLKAVREQYVTNGSSRYTANKNTGRVRRLFKWAVEEELVDANVFHALVAVSPLKRGRTKAPERPPVEPVSEEQVDQVLARLPDVVADILRFQRATGCRPTEACDVRPGDIDRSGGVWIYTPAEHKTSHHGKKRQILIGPKAQAILTPYLLRPDDTFCFSPADSERKRRELQHAERRTPLSCGNKPGSHRKRMPKRKPRDRYDVDSYRRAIHRACDKAGIERWSPNRLRHSAATEIRSKYGLEAAQVILGHARADVTQVYAERDMALARRVALEVG